MKKFMTIVACLMMTVAAMAQNKSYKCTYQMTMQVESQFEGLDDQMREMLMEQMAKMKMYFTLTYVNGRSLFELDEEQTDNPFAAQAGHTVFVDYGKGMMVSQESFFGRTFLIEEPLATLDWKIGTERRTIDGRVCIKATASESDHELVAWYATGTPIPAGPMAIGGLPGLIVEMEMPGATYKLVDIKVMDKAKELKAPTKGKKVTREEYNKTVEERLQQFGATMGGGVQVIQMH